MSKALPRPEHDTTNFCMYKYNAIYVKVLKQMIAINCVGSDIQDL